MRRPLVGGLAADMAHTCALQGCGPGRERGTPGFGTQVVLLSVLHLHRTVGVCSCMHAVACTEFVRAAVRLELGAGLFRHCQPVLEVSGGVSVVCVWLLACDRAA